MPKRPNFVRIKFVKRPRIIDIDSFLDYFFTTEKQKEQAIHIIQTLKKEKFVTAENWRKFVLSSVGLYTDVMWKLRKCGLVEKREGIFELSREFIYGLRKLMDFWDDYTS